MLCCIEILKQKHHPESFFKQNLKTKILPPPPEEKYLFCHHSKMNKNNPLWMCLRDRHFILRVLQKWPNSSFFLEYSWLNPFRNKHLFQIQVLDTRVAAILRLHFFSRNGHSLQRRNKAFSLDSKHLPDVWGTLSNHWGRKAEKVSWIDPPWKAGKERLAQPTQNFLKHFLTCKRGRPDSGGNLEWNAFFHFWIHPWRIEP